ncbi:hypothetical protein P3T23_005538 [Paraburkholderia sp. GAS448]
MTRPCPVLPAVAVSLVVAFAYEPHVMAQTGTPGMKHMQDAQRKAEQKARGTHTGSNTHAEHPKAGSAVAASAP